jgi:hypothetical protein
MSSSSATRPSMAISSDYKRDLYAEISTSYRDSSTESTKPKPSIKETICDLYLESSDYTSDNLRLRFRLFGPSIPV